MTKMKEPSAIIRDPMAIIVGLLYLPPIKLTNKITNSAPKSCEAGMSADLVLVSMNCLSMAGSPAGTRPLIAKPSSQQKMKRKITKIQILLRNCAALNINYRKLSRLVGKPTMWFPIRSDTNRPVQL